MRIKSAVGHHKPELRFEHVSVVDHVMHVPGSPFHSIAAPSSERCP
ncbi:Uncharacterized protein PPKH_0419 [Pseudomonas putida]|nr:Uncharacterized protein PPKH_0419 [Pseudomonas putida]